MTTTSSPTGKEIYNISATNSSSIYDVLGNNMLVNQNNNQFTLNPPVSGPPSLKLSTIEATPKRLIVFPPNILKLKEELMNQFNEEEIERISKDLGIVSNSIENKMLEISKITNTEFICLTLGDKGVVFYDSKFHYQDAIKIKVLNTVGAGDSFLAMIIEGMISNISVKLFLKRAVNLSAYVCSKNGPNPEYNKDQF